MDGLKLHVDQTGQAVQDTWSTSSLLRSRGLRLTPGRRSPRRTLLCSVRWRGSVALGRLERPPLQRLADRLFGLGGKRRRDVTVQ